MILAGLFCCLCSGAMAQERKVQHKPFIDERRFHYGFTLGFHDQSLSLQNNGFIHPETGEQWMAVNDRHGLGFSVGVLGEWKLNKYFSVRLVPSLHFGSKHITFRELGTGKEESQDMKSTYVAVPVDIKVSAPRFNNYRPYVMAGVSPMYDLTVGKHTKLRTKPFNFSLEVGMGCDLYLPFFKLIPELKFCFGLGNVLNKKRNDLTDPTQHIYTESIDKATTNMVVLSFYFE
ncbi:MAG: PorT family protein [Bacteroidaceae bacterium]|nr:PorT family protein [Bacteroidaceae bacterium]